MRKKRYHLGQVVRGDTRQGRNQLPSTPEEEETREITAFCTETISDMGRRRRRRRKHRTHKTFHSSCSHKDDYTVNLRARCHGRLKGPYKQ
jgi:hypothetical protein